MVYAPRELGPIWIVQDFVTLRRRFDRPIEHRLSPEELSRLLGDHKNEVQRQEENYSVLNREKQRLEKEIERIHQIKSTDEITDEPSMSVVPFPHQSFLHLRHWRRAPKSLKVFLQALACFFSTSKRDFLSELRSHPKLCLHPPSATALNEFRATFLHVEQVSPEHLRKRSIDAYQIAIWLQLEATRLTLTTRLAHTHKELTLAENRIKNQKANLERTEKHRRSLVQTN